MKLFKSALIVMGIFLISNCSDNSMSSSNILSSESNFFNEDALPYYAGDIPNDTKSVLNKTVILPNDAIILDFEDMDLHYYWAAAEYNPYHEFFYFENGPEFTGPYQYPWLPLWSFMYYQNWNGYNSQTALYTPFGGSGFPISTIEPIKPIGFWVKSGGRNLNTVLSVDRYIDGVFQYTETHTFPANWKYQWFEFTQDIPSDRFVFNTNNFYYLDDFTYTEFQQNQSPEVYVDENLSPLWPPNHKMKKAISGRYFDADGDNVTLRVVYFINNYGPTLYTGPNEDIEVSYGDGEFVINLLAEREGKGQGRNYIIEIIADDGTVWSPSYFVEVEVPHDMRN